MATEQGMKWDYINMEDDSDFLEYQFGSVHWKPISKKSTPMEFPVPKDININMMPFVVEPGYSTIPSEYREYIPFIDICVESIRTYSRRNTPLIYYLTIHECMVPASTSQRRPGLHTDAHSTESWGEGIPKGIGKWHPWGGGECGAEHVPRSGGIFMASTVAESTAVWDCQIKVPGLLGDCEDKRERLAKYGPTLLEANRIYWITDRTPHESVPLAQDTYRQYFRLVTENVGVWYEQHSTTNPLGVVPPDNVRIIHDNKFADFLLK